MTTHTHRDLDLLRRQHRELKALAERQAARVDAPDCLGDEATIAARRAEAQMTRDQADALARQVRTLEARAVWMAAPTLAGVPS